MENGRIKIVCDLKPTGDIEQDKLIIPKIISLTLSYHQKNVADMQRLINYYYNKTDILYKTKTQQPSINNKTGIDYANIAVNTINGYAFSNSLTYSSRKVNDEDAMKAFNDSLDDDNYSSKLKKIAFYYGITGLAYKYITPTTEEEISEGIFYKTITDIDPRNTYCVYFNDIEQEKICAIHYYQRKIYDKKLNVESSQKVYVVWTKWHQWQFIAGGINGYENITYTINGLEYDAYPLVYKKIPIIEYRSLDGTSYFELAIDLINAINAIASSRTDDVQQSVDYIIVLRDIDTESDGALSRIKDCLKDGILSFRSNEGALVQPEINVLDTKLNQQEVQTLQEFLCQKIEEVLNIPNRNNRASGGDTGSAVESRNGFRSLENKASIITDDIIASENEALSIIFAICKNIQRCEFRELRPRDIEIKDNRNKYENITSASNAYSVLRQVGMNDRTALEVTRLTPDAITVSKLNEQAKEMGAEFTLRTELKKAQELSKLTQNQNNESNNNGSNSNQE